MSQQKRINTFVHGLIGTEKDNFMKKITTSVILLFCSTLFAATDSGWLSTGNTKVVQVMQYAGTEGELQIYNDVQNRCINLIAKDKAAGKTPVSYRVKAYPFGDYHAASCDVRYLVK
jgi:hypothetical protein